MCELCVMCGAVLPTEYGSQVCRTCELTAGIKFMQFKCPECGEEMEVWHKNVIQYTQGVWDGFPRMTVELIYHCDKCGCDWDSLYDTIYGDVFQNLPTRHYWG